MDRRKQVHQLDADYPLTQLKEPNPHRKDPSDVGAAVNGDAAQ